VAVALELAVVVLLLRCQCLEEEVSQSPFQQRRHCWPVGCE
jgi:hypothetical protein